MHKGLMICRGALGAAWLVLCPLLAGADAPGGGAKEPVVAGKLTTAQGTVARRAKPGGDWDLPAKGSEVRSGELYVGLPDATLESKNGAVHLHLRANLLGTSPLPTIESAVVAEHDAKFDLAFALDRGRVVLENAREKGGSRVLVRAAGRRYELTLQTPGALVGLELCGRYLPGAKFTTDPKKAKENVPFMTLMLLVVKGKADLKCPEYELALAAPPGPALLQWDSAHGQDRHAQELQKLPEWAAPRKPDKERDARQARFRELARKGTVASALGEMLKSKDAGERAMAVYAAGALDLNPLVAGALEQGAYPDLWAHAVVALRHQMGRAPGVDLKFYRHLTDDKKMKPAHAEIVMQLLHTFGEDDLAEPATYSMLVEYLRHDLLAIRGLAAWHLYRLVPAGRKIKFNPAGSKVAIAKGYTAWKKLIPAGQLPPAPGKKPSAKP